MIRVLFISAMVWISASVVYADNKLEQIANLDKKSTPVLNEQIRSLEKKISTSYYATVYQNADQSISNNTTTVLNFNSEYKDTDNIHDTSSVLNSRLTCKTAGVYIIYFNCQWAAHATGYRYSELYFNGATSLDVDQVIPGAANVVTNDNMVIKYLAENDYVQVRVIQTSGGNLNLSYAADNSPVFGMIRLGSQKE